MLKSVRISNFVCLAVLGLAVTVGLVATSCVNKSYTPEGAVNQEVVKKIGLYETYQVGEIHDALRVLDQEAAKSGGFVDSLSFGKLTRFEAIAEGSVESPAVGNVAPEDTAAVNTIIAQYGPKCLPADLRLTWTAKPEIGYLQNGACRLIALRLTNGMPAMTGETIVGAKAGLEEDGTYSIYLSLNDEGARAFSILTAQNVNRALAVVLDGKVYSYPSVSMRIEGGRILITGYFTKEEACNVVDFIYGKDNLKL